MMLCAAVVLLSGAVHLTAAASSPRPRGVGPEFAGSYKDAGQFACILNPSIKLSVSQINDDYCDCPDGSDEPGTSACAHISPLSPQNPSPGLPSDVVSTPALPGFYCKNKGHNPTYIPFTLVNDGVCDYDVCCDGSDEWSHVGGLKCEDRCKEIGKQWKVQNEARMKSHNSALRKKAELVKEAARMRLEIENWLTNAEIQLAATELQVKDFEKEKADIERQERGKIVRSSGQGGKAGVLAGLAKARLGQLTDTLGTLRAQRDSLNARLLELESVLSTFKEEYNPNFNDEGVKRAVRAWEDYAARDKSDGTPENFETDLSDAANGGDTIPWQDFEEGDDVPELDILYQFEAYLPQPLREWVDQKLRELRIFLIDNGILAGSQGSEGESKAVREARERLEVAIKARDNFKKGQREREESLKQDFGPDDVFRSLKDKCVSMESGEYTYEVCWMGGVTQISKKGGSRNGMGNFARFEKMEVDEEVGADGKGLGKGERVVMKYENGAHCWQGPNRSTTVVLACAETEEIWKVMEEAKCVYRVEAGTPAVCETGEAAAAKGSSGGAAARDEL